MLRFSAPVLEVLERFGAVPLPPYLRREPLPEDRDWYQTVYATAPGAVAAPTAGLHLTRSTLEALEARGVERAAITLHVGPGTFKPVKVERVEDHRLDAERYLLPEETARRDRADASARRPRGGGGNHRGALSREAAAQRAAATRHARRAPGRASGAGETDLFIQPGFGSRWWTCCSPTSTCRARRLLMLVAAFAGKERVLAAFREAIASGYRFYSYGDAMVAARRCDAP